MAQKPSPSQSLPAVPMEGVLKISDNLYIDLDARTFCSFADRWIHSEAPQDKDFDVLALLASAKNKVFSRDLILDRVWLNDPPADDRCIDKIILRLRAILRAFAPSVDVRNLIATKRGVGYQFNPECYVRFPSLEAVFAPAAPKEEAGLPSAQRMEADFNQAHTYALNGEHELSLSIHSALARQNYAPSINYLGVCYCKGENLEQNIPLGIQYYQKAADLNYPAALLNLGDYHMNSELGGYDEKKAFELYLRAASHPDAPDADAMYRLYLCCKYGIGTDPNPIEAELWRSKAASHGVTDHKVFYQVGPASLDKSSLFTGDRLHQLVTRTARCRLIRRSSGEEIPLYDALTLAGSDRAICALLLSQSPDSRHALIRVHESHITLIDLFSSCGTFVNEKKLLPLEEIILHRNDVLSFGGEIFLLAYP